MQRDDEGSSRPQPRQEHQKSPELDKKRIKLEDEFEESLKIVREAMDRLCRRKWVR